MRILFMQSSPVWIHGLPNGFLDNGHQVKVSGPLTAKNIPQMLAEFCPELMITIGWTAETVGFRATWIGEHVKASNIPHIYWATEDSPNGQFFALSYITKTQPAFVFTICPAAIDNYRRHGIKAAYLDFGFHAKVHYPTDMEEKYRSDIATVANAYPALAAHKPYHYRLQSINALIHPLLQQKLRIDFWGGGWDKMGERLGDIPIDWLHGSLPYTEANKVYSSAKIILGLQNHPSQLTQRVYEILASGGFLLTNDTPAVRQLFEPSKDLVVTASPSETVSLVHYYLNHPIEREKIRRQGQRSVKRHSYGSRAAYILKVLQNEGIITASQASSKLNSP